MRKGIEERVGEGLNQNLNGRKTGKGRGAKNSRTLDGRELFIGLQFHILNLHQGRPWKRYVGSAFKS